MFSRCHMIVVLTVRVIFSLRTRFIVDGLADTTVGTFHQSRSCVYKEGIGPHKCCSVTIACIEFPGGNRVGVTRKAFAASSVQIVTPYPVIEGRLLEHAGEALRSKCP